MFKWWIYSEMKIHKYTVIIFFSLFLQIEGENITEWSVQEGKNFTFHLPNVESDRVHISSVEWKQRDRNKMLAIFRLDNANETVIFQQGSRLQFMQNQSIVIRGVKQEDTGNYTCKVIFKDGKIQTHNISLTVYSGNTEQTPTYNTTSTTSGKILRDMDTQELEAGHTLHLDSIDVDGCVCVAPSCPRVIRNKLFGLLSVECKIVVGTPCCQVLNLFPVGCLIVATDQAYHHGVISQRVEYSVL